MVTHTHSLPLTRRVQRTFTWPRLYIEIPRKDLWLSALVCLAGLSLPALMVFGIIAPSLALGLLSFLLTFAGGTVFFIRLGEIA